jgi:glycogen debranching enzyme
MNERSRLASVPAPRSAPPPDPVSARLTGRSQLLAAFAPAPEPLRMLRHDDLFAALDPYGDISPGGSGEQGLYHHGTRFLSCLLIEVGGRRPLLLGSTVGDDDQLDVDCTNPDLTDDGEVWLPVGTLHLAISKLLWRGVCYQRLWVRNLALHPVEAVISLYFEADFADVLDLRTANRPRGRRLPPVTTHDSAGLGYLGRDGVLRRTIVQFDPAPTLLTGSTAVLKLSLQPQQATAFFVAVACECGSVPAILAFEDARAAARADRERYNAGACDIVTSNDRCTASIRRGLADVRMLTTELATGPYPFAGLPWFNTTFGRDGILTALECLWLRPQLARGVLAHLAANQATEVVPEQDAEPGKILHETRDGELAALGVTPFTRYYGSVDATPLFVVLAGDYYDRTADRPFLQSLWPNIDAALNWIDRYGDRDGDGFIEYQRQSARGLVHQGWKDSDDAVFHADGSPAIGPVALCEVQGYVYAARCAGAALAAVLGHLQRAAQLSQQAEELRVRFERSFWCEELSTYALALDGNKRPCRVRTSNAGHTLFSGIASVERARRVATTLLETVSFSGWGVRSLAASERRYNPLGYHVGAVWPHDNALIARGMARYGLTDEAFAICTALLDAAAHLDSCRMPELFCGFPRRPGVGPMAHPSACAPQAWSAGAALLLLQACLGLEIHAASAEICFTQPRLPAGLGEIRINNLAIAGASVDLMLLGHGKNTRITELRRDGELRIALNQQ